MTKEDLFEQILSVARDVVPVMVELMPNQTFKRGSKDICFVDLGINSIDFIEIITNLTEFFKVDIPAERFVNACRVQGVADILYEELSRRA